MSGRAEELTGGELQRGIELFGRLSEADVGRRWGLDDPPRAGDTGLGEPPDEACSEARASARQRRAVAEGPGPRARAQRGVGLIASRHLDDETVEWYVRNRSTTGKVRSGGREGMVDNGRGRRLFSRPTVDSPKGVAHGRAV
jgi:hypothetical protein